VLIKVSSHTERPERPHTEWNLYKKDFKTLHELKTNMVKRVRAAIEEQGGYWQIFIIIFDSYSLQLFNCIILL
jgi:hypothetical protein